MAFRVIPRDIKFVDLFIRSGQNLAEAASKLKDLVDSFDRLAERIAEIQALEKVGDKLDDEIGMRLEQAFVAPFDREDIHDLTVKLDDCVDFIQAAAESLVIYDVKQPTDEARQLADILARQADQLSAALAKLERMKDLGPNLELVHDLEHEADGVSRAAIARLFRERLDPLEVIKWREIYLVLENAIDAGEDAAESIERMVHKRV
jgi:predicted phosphate transport protein (TIGR00153 family)